MLNIEETLKHGQWNSSTTKEGQFITYRKEVIEAIIARLQKPDTCLICKHRSGCKHADYIRDGSGVKSNEMWFYCFQPREDI